MNCEINCPTSPFTILELLNPLHDVPELHKIRRYFVALKLGKGSSGRLLKTERKTRESQKQICLLVLKNGKGLVGWFNGNKIDRNVYLCYRQNYPTGPFSILEPQNRLGPVKRKQPDQTFHNFKALKSVVRCT